MQPIFVLWLVAVFALGFAFLSALRAQNGISVLAELAARTEGWESRISDENDRSGCHAKPAHPSVEYPDGDKQAGDRVLLTWDCWIVFPPFAGTSLPAIPYSVSAESVISGKEPSASPSPSSSESPSEPP